MHLDILFRRNEGHAGTEPSESCCDCSAGERTVGVGTGVGGSETNLGCGAGSCYDCDFELGLSSGWKLGGERKKREEDVL